MTELQAKSLEIILRWIDHATENNLGQHLVCFWYIRDLAEGLTWAKRKTGDILMFLHTKCKYSADREILVKLARENMRPGPQAVYVPNGAVDKDSEPDTY